MHIRAQPDSSESGSSPVHRMDVNIELFKVELSTQEGPSTPRGTFQRSFSVPMPPAIDAISNKTLSDFLRDPVDAPPQIDAWSLSSPEAVNLNHWQVYANNAARSELHSRASFAMSCLTLVIVGCALGVMFRSGNFLNAFAASFVPALLCITLIICGQQTATHVPWVVGPAFKDPLPMGLVFIWGGNAAVLASAIFLTYRLQRR
jgi:lipopolysaccharide export LptBFGC system permease protein LptF